MRTKGVPNRRAPLELGTKPRVVNVSYLNGVPYRTLSEVDDLEYLETDPAEGARMLHERECDLALIPLAEFVLHGGYEMLPYGIASNGPVESVLLLSEKPFSEIEQIYVDRNSHSSVALLQLLCLQEYGGLSKSIRFSRMDADEILKRISGKNAGLLIGDQALRPGDSFSHRLDLGEVWRGFTSQPFLFAVWAYRKDSIERDLLDRVEGAFLYGLEKRSTLARQWAEEHGHSREHAEKYVLERIQYELNAEIIEGANRFVDLASEAGIFPASSPFNSKRTNDDLDSLLELASSGERLSISQGLALAEQASLADLALAVESRNGQEKERISYIVDRNINYTNVCDVYCRFCAFYRAPGKKDGYVLSREEIGQKIEEMLEAGGVQILLQGGLNPELGIEYYEELFRWIKSNYPINLHALSADEILHIAEVSNLSFEETFSRLIDAGLGSFPGGGAEILVDRVRYRIARLKSPSADWLEVHRVAHRLGLRSSCTMMFGVQESWEDRLLHLHKLRSLQDETGGFTAFICWPFQDENTKLKKGDTSAAMYLRVQAVARLFLDNIDNVQSSWVTMGPSVGQLGLLFGANDFGSVMFEENVVSSAGTTYCMNSDYIEQHIREAGYEPWRRNVHFEAV